MKSFLKTICLLAFTAYFSLTVLAQTKRPIAFDDLISMKRVADAQISPDGKWVAYVVNAIDKQANRGKRSIWLVPTAGGEARQLITSQRNDDTPRWSADGKWIAFLSSRDGAPQIFVAAADSSNPRKVTDVPLGVADFTWSPDGKLFAFSTEVYPECADLKCTADKAAAADASKVKAVIADRLLYRHWSDFKLGKRSHVFVVSANGGAAKDLTPGDFDSPPFSLGDPLAYDFSPDGKELCFARNTDKQEALSTNNDLFIVPIAGGEAKRITGANTGYDSTPRYSPDGKWIAYRSQDRYGYEADRFKLMLYNRQSGAVKELTTDFDRSVGEVIWAADSQGLFLVAEDQGRELLGSVSINEGGVESLIAKTASNGISLSTDGKTLAFTRSSLTMPAEVFAANSDGTNARQLTKTNAALLAQLDLNAAEDFWFDGAKVSLPNPKTHKLGKAKVTTDFGKNQVSKIHGFIVKPPQFDKAKKYPMVLLVHGGPQGAWLDNWGYRWNAQMWAARGYVTVLINPHGSTGYGQGFTEQISGEWGGAVYEDLMKGVDYVVKQGYVDPARIGAAGGSYGGYMVNWMMGHTDRFKAYVSHAGIFNSVSMYATEELWFQEWEFKGTPWEKPELYTKWSPHMHAAKFKTPTLVVHGELDYRVPIGEGIQLFSTLQRKNVPSRLLYFPDEGHWILKPQNSELWYKTVLDWFDQWLKPGGATASR